MRPTFKFELNNKKNTNGKQTILVRMCANRKLKRLKTQYEVEARFFNKKGTADKWVRETHPDSNQLNGQLSKLRLDLAVKADKFIQEKDFFDLNLFSDRIKTGKKDKYDCIFEYYEKEFLPNKMLSSRTTEGYTVLINTLKEYYTGKTLSFKQIDVRFILRFKNYLKNKGLKHNTIITRLKNLRAIFNHAVQNENVNRELYPFIKLAKTLPLSWEKKDVDYLSAKDIQGIEKLELKKGSGEWHTRHIFLFCYYSCGTRIGDAITMKWDNVHKGQLRYQMAKTGKKCQPVQLPMQAKAIIEQYSQKNTFIFPFLTEEDQHLSEHTFKKRLGAKTAYINKCLKSIAKKAKIETKLTSHIARHSFANLLIRKNIGSGMISDLLGHSSIAITESYLKSFSTEEKSNVITSVFH